jgi:hypothetical protein
MSYLRRDTRSQSETAAGPPSAETVYPAPPQNKKSPPFHILAGLFDRLSAERKPDKRRRMLSSWFDVRRLLTWH